MTEDIAKKNLARVKRLYKKLANAETVTGQEAGLLDFYAFFVTCFNVNNHRSDKLPFETEDMEAIKSKIKTQEEWNIYCIYRNLLSVILDGYNYYLERLKGIEKPYNDNLREIYDLSLAEDRQRELDTRPLVVTEAQYKRLYQKTLESLQEQKECYYNLFFRVLLKAVAEPDKAPEAVKDAFNVYKQIIVDGEKQTTAFDELAQVKPFKNTDNLKRAFFEVFKDHYPVLYTAIEGYLSSNGLTLSGVGNDLFKKCYAWQELAQKGIIGFENIMQPTNKSIAIQVFLDGGQTNKSWSQQQRAYNYGIAIMHYPSPDCVDQNGDYKEPTFKSVLRTIDSPEHDIKGKADALNDNIQEMYIRAKNVYAYNAFLEILQKAYEIEDLLEAFGIVTTGMINIGNYYNEQIEKYTRKLYGDELIIKTKKQAIKKVFKKLDFESQKPNTNNQDYIIKLVNKIKFKPDKFVMYFTRSTTLVNMIMTGEKFE